MHATMSSQAKSASTESANIIRSMKPKYLHNTYAGLIVISEYLCYQVKSPQSKVLICYEANSYALHYDKTYPGLTVS